MKPVHGKVIALPVVSRPVVGSIVKYGKGNKLFTVTKVSVDNILTIKRKRFTRFVIEEEVTFYKYFVVSSVTSKLNDIVSISAMNIITANGKVLSYDDYPEIIGELSYKDYNLVENGDWIDGKVTSIKTRIIGVQEATVVNIKFDHWYSRIFKVKCENNTSKVDLYDFQNKHIGTVMRNDINLVSIRDEIKVFCLICPKCKRSIDIN